MGGKHGTQLHKNPQNDYFVLKKHHREEFTTQVHTVRLNAIYCISLWFWWKLREVFFLTLQTLSFSTYWQDFAVQELPSTQKIQHVESVDAEEQGQPQRSCEQQEKNVHEKAGQQHTPNKAGGKKKYEPYTRWKNLGLVSPCGYVIRCVLKYLQATT